MTKYEELVKKIEESVEKSGGKRYSKSDYESMALAILNSPEYEETIVIKGEDGNPVELKNPISANYRKSLEGVLSQFGIDKSEMGKLNEIEFDKKHAAAVAELSTSLVKDYIGTGRKLILPMRSAEESQMEIYEDEVEETVRENRKPVQNEDGSYSNVPTGTKTKTKKHKAVKVSNKVPAWLKETL